MNMILNTLPEVMGRLDAMGAKRVGWFGFSADPPTMAHARIVESVLAQGLVDCVVVFVSGKQMGKGYIVADEERVEMAEVMVESLLNEDPSVPRSGTSPLGHRHGGAGRGEIFERILFSTFDVGRGVAWKWWDLWEETGKMKEKREKRKDIKHWFILGSDQWDRMEEDWMNGKELKEKGRFIVVPRKSKDERAKSKDGSNVVCLDVEPISGSSTKVRNGDLRLVSDEVRRYIEDHHLYGL